MYRYILFIGCLFLGYCGCKLPYQRVFIQQIEPLGSEGNASRMPAACNEQSAYIPDLDHVEHTPMRYVRVNFHIMRKGDGSENFSDQEGREFIQHILKLANGKLGRNTKMNLPEGNNTPVVPMRYRYVLTPDPDVRGDDGIYFHNDDELYYMISSGKGKNNYSKAV